MNTKLIQSLKEQAEELNACHKALRDFPTDAQGMIDRWKANIDFAIDNDYPSVAFIKENFDRSLLHENLIFVDETVNLPYAPNGIYVLCGECRGVLQFRDWAVATIYVRHTSKVSIIAEDNAKIFVRTYDEADADVCELGDAVVKTIRK